MTKALIEKLLQGKLFVLPYKSATICHVLLTLQFSVVIFCVFIYYYFCPGALLDTCVVHHQGTKLHSGSAFYVYIILTLQLLTIS